MMNKIILAFFGLTLFQSGLVQATDSESRPRLKGNIFLSVKLLKLTYTPENMELHRAARAFIKKNNAGESYQKMKMQADTVKYHIAPLMETENDQVKNYLKAIIYCINKILEDIESEENAQEISSDLHAIGDVVATTDTGD